jgi:uncharacterized protein YdhG (YjbR/CyaY superfamily)
MARPASVEAYLAALPDAQRAVLERLRATILAAAPGAEESIAYDMPALRMGGKFLVSYAAYSRHFSLFPASGVVMAACGDELRPYVTGKATIQFTMRKPLPDDLVTRIVTARVEEILRRADR